MLSYKYHNIAIIGCGKIAETSHLPALLKSRRVKLTALIDKNIENALTLKKRYSMDCQVAEDLTCIEENLDGAIIATPNNTHYPIAKACLQRKIPVLIEKPMCTKSSEATELCALAKKQNLFISVGYMFRYVHTIRLMKELLLKKYFGKILGYEFEFGTSGGWSPISGYSLNKEQCGGGVLMISGTHIIDRLIYWFGMPDALEYEDDSHGSIEANCKARFYYKSDLGDFTGSIFLSKTVSMRGKFVFHSENSMCEIIGDKIVVYPKQEENLQYEISGRHQAKDETKDLFEAQINNFIDCIEGYAEPTVDGDFASKSVVLIEKMYSQKKQMDEPWMIRI